LIDRYRLLSLVGEGGMGVVYRAEHTVLGKQVAMKLLHSHLTEVPEAVERFFREARTAADVATDHVVQVTDSGQTEDGTVFLVMELLSGESLADLLDREQRLDVERAVRLALQVTEALAAVHEKGVIHRDLKPGNIQLARVGKEKDFARREGAKPRRAWSGATKDFVTLLDFGIAKIRESSIKLTQTGMILGSPSYMAPEQAASRPIDHRTDIYALGVILYEMLTGAPPFFGEKAPEILMAHLTDDPPPPRAVRPDIPLELERIVLRCLAKSPENRPEDMAGLGEDLRACLEAGTPPEEPAVALGTTQPPAAFEPTVSDDSPLDDLAQDETRPQKADEPAPEQDNAPASTAAIGAMVSGRRALAVASVLALAAGVAAALVLRSGGGPREPRAAARPDVEQVGAADMAAPAVSDAPDAAAAPTRKAKLSKQAAAGRARRKREAEKKRKAESARRKREVEKKRKAERERRKQQEERERQKQQEERERRAMEAERRRAQQREAERERREQEAERRRAQQREHEREQRLKRERRRRAREREAERERRFEREREAERERRHREPGPEDPHE
jgi:serine/threonine-protein kinase